MASQDPQLLQNQHQKINEKCMLDLNTHVYVLCLHIHYVPAEILKLAAAFKGQNTHVHIILKHVYGGETALMICN